MKRNEIRVLNLFKKNSKDGKVTLTYKQAIEKGLKFEKKKGERIISTVEFIPSNTAFVDIKKRLIKKRAIKKAFTNLRKPTYIITSK